MSISAKELTDGNLLANVTWIIDELLRLDPYILLDESRTANCVYHDCPSCGEILDLADRNSSLYLVSTDFECICPDCGHMFNEEDAERSSPPIFEWYVVSELLGRKLADEGEIILDGMVWGRQATGQDVCMDRVIRDVAAQLG